MDPFLYYIYKKIKQCTCKKYNMGKTNAVVADFESIHMKQSDKSIIHTISLIPITMNTGKMCQYTIHSEKGLIIKISDVLNNKFVKEYLELTHDTEHVNNKHVLDRRTCDEHGIKVIRHMRFHDAVKAMNKFITHHGGFLLSHNLIGDLQALSDTQNHIGGRRIIKKNLATFCKTGMYDPLWKDINLVCTISIFCNRCPKMYDEYKKWLMNKGGIDLYGSRMNKLENLIQFVKNDITYHQTHTAVQDTIDLFTVLKYAYRRDGPILDKCGYTDAPKWQWVFAN